MASDQAKTKSSYHSSQRCRSVHRMIPKLSPYFFLFRNWLLLLLLLLFLIYLTKIERQVHESETHLLDFKWVQNFFTPAESKAFVKTAESIGFAHQGSLGPAKGEAYRDNDRISVNDPALADAIWASGLNQLFSDIKIRGKSAVGLNPNLRFYRYKVGQRFGRHIDESVHLGDGKRTHYTLLVYLSGGVPKGKSDLKSSKDSSPEPLVGGETVFYGSRNNVVAEVAPTEGMALLHIHGDKCMLHEARNVSKGINSSLSLCLKPELTIPVFFLGNEDDPCNSSDHRGWLGSPSLNLPCPEPFS